jgi:serine/threonine-protein kinase
MARRYRVESLVGVGAAGRVYRATRIDSAGRRETVALKVLQADVPEDVRVRLRDEARILSVLRHPVFVRADPPLRVGGRWAVCMEYVEGETAYRLLRHGPYPPRAALEVVAAVAGALVAAWEAPGPSGAPIRLLHRDLKPGNLQITPHGQVRILDLGIAHAALPEREARTGAIVLGTLGYIAPERQRGMEGPPAEVWSLGMVLRVLATGEQPLRVDQLPTPLGASLAWVDLAAQMLDPDPDARLRMREVAERASELARGLEGEGIREWAARHVRGGEGRAPRCGQVLHEEGGPAEGLLRRWFRSLVGG